MLYVKKPELKKKPVDKPSTTAHGTLFTIVAVVGVSLLISIGFAYMGYAILNKLIIYWLSHLKSILDCNRTRPIVLHGHGNTIE